MNLDYAVSVLGQLCNIPSPGGYTDRVISLVEKELENMDVFSFRTRKGALIATIPGKNMGAKKLIAAHVDTLGAMVKEIKSNGRLALSQIGGYALTSIEGENVTVITMEDKEYGGTIYFNKPSVHIHQEARNDVRKLEDMELILDERVVSKEDVKALGIEVGDFVAFDPRFKVTESGFIKSRHLDDKAAVAAMLAAVKELKESKFQLEDTIQLLFSNYEEVGHGASYSLNPTIEEVLCVDMGAPGIGQNGDEFSVTIAAKDANGPYDYNMRKNMVALASKNNIPYKQDILVYYGSDANAILCAGNDVRYGLIGPGVYASHTYERTHKDALGATVSLLVAYMKDNKEYDVHMCKCKDK
ncbi:MAG: M42 family metallopeptidase [Filifactoraceae bacterium]